jgi:hypothetical protein
MQLEDTQLISVVRKTMKPIDVRDAENRFAGAVSPGTALRLAQTGRYVGVGSRSRIRYLRELCGQVRRIGAEASHTTV